MTTIVQTAIVVLAIASVRFLARFGGNLQRNALNPTNSTGVRLLARVLYWGAILVIILGVTVLLRGGFSLVRGRVWRGEAPPATTTPSPTPPTPLPTFTPWPTTLTPLPTFTLGPAASTIAAAVTSIAETATAQALPTETPAPTASVCAGCPTNTPAPTETPTLTVTATVPPTNTPFPAPTVGNLDFGYSKLAGSQPEPIVRRPPEPGALAKIGSTISNVVGFVFSWKGIIMLFLLILGYALYQFAALRGLVMGILRGILRRGGGTPGP